MKRGLKVHCALAINRFLGRSNHCPDEKGTESDHRGITCQECIYVATIAPMKRGLKAVYRVCYPC